MITGGIDAAITGNKLLIYPLMGIKSNVINKAKIKEAKDVPISFSGIFKFFIVALSNLYFCCSNSWILVSCFTSFATALRKRSDTSFLIVSIVIIFSNIFSFPFFVFLIVF